MFLKIQKNWKNGNSSRFIPIRATAKWNHPEKCPDWKSPNEHEGLAAADIDLDGVLDIVGRRMVV
jgi:hypothetical protein